MFGPPPMMPMGAPPFPPPMPFGATPIASARSAALPMMGGGGFPAAPAAGLAQSGAGLGSIGRFIPMIQNAGKWLPMIQKYGPMVRQIPGMIQKANQVGKVLKNANAPQSAAPANASQEKKEDPSPSFALKEGAQPPPKLYV
ncbi:hypothetical protein HUG15_09850 [Salicibibacter cibarius]|uniref:YqfQ-like protein n=1 Tax=Salicibibacter cibarius TaxID=2743000 RepID=A0A7T6Z2P6_9BACI|nr:hypothetical protein [Salicibibacter cibarius]QQK75841.1 hypothetical protein HUG15_09850 [Salicibibacter cibarius]